MPNFTIDFLKKAVDGEFAAVRRVTRLEPQGGKIFPPTYEGGEYADEKRLVDGRNEAVETVLLDSVQSQANRLELAMLRAYDNGRIRMPLLQVDFGIEATDPILQEVGRITALEAPHRMCDAIFRDSVYNEKPFRESSIGATLNSAKAANATPVFALCPTALILGFWDSTGPRGGLGAKVQRALVSEIVGYQEAEKLEGKRTSSRIDPLEISNNVDIYKKDGDWTLGEVPGAKKVKPSEINHGNITPSFRDKDKKLNHGGVSLRYAEQNVVLSLAALRRLRFPLDGKTTPEVDSAARIVLAALGLAGICFLDEDGYDLRSRCLLDGKPGTFELIGRGVVTPFDLASDVAVALLAEAVDAAKKLGLPWPETPVTLQPSANLAKLVTESRKRSMASESSGS